MPIQMSYTRRDYERWYESGDWKRETFWDALTEAAKKRPEKIALAHGERRVSYKELHERVERFAAGLAALGIGREDVVSVQLPNSVELAVAILALCRLEAIYNPLNPGYRRHEVELITGLVASKAVVAPRVHGGFDFTALHDEVAAAREGACAKIVVGEAPSKKWRSFDEVSAQGEKFLSGLPGPPDPDAVFLLGSTSGTTGNPKIYIHTAQTQLQEARGMNRLLGVDESAVFLCMAPMTHRGALMFGFFTAIAAGATLVLLDSYDPEAVLDLFARERITHFMAIPTQVLDLLDRFEKKRRDVSALKLAVMAGAPVGKNLVERFSRAWPHCLPVTGYGMSECGYATLTLPGDAREKLYSSGRPVMNMEIQIRGEQGRPLASNEVGEVHIRGPLVCGGYYANQKATREAIDTDGWLASGDLGYLDDEGYLHPVGRIKHVIIRGGLKIHAEELEFLLGQHPAVAAVIVVGVPDARLGEKGCACVVLKEGTAFDLPALRRFLEERGVAKFQWPEFVETFEAFPRNPVGKVDRRAVAEQARRRTAERGKA